MNSARPYGDQVSATTLVSSKYYYASFQLIHSVPLSPRDLWKVSETSTMEGFAKTVYGF